MYSMPNYGINVNLTKPTISDKNPKSLNNKKYIAGIDKKHAFTLLSIHTHTHTYTRYGGSSSYISQSDKSWCLHKILISDTSQSRIRERHTHI